VRIVDKGTVYSKAKGDGICLNKLIIVRLLASADKRPQMFFPNRTVVYLSTELICSNDKSKFNIGFVTSWHICIDS
jgi:hypothetical protein